MFTKNFKKLMSLKLLNATSSNNNNSSYPVSITLTYLDGNTITTDSSEYTNEQYSLVYAMSDILSTKAENNRAYLIAGTGTGTISDDNYNLFRGASGCSCVSASSNTSANFTKIYTATFQNNTSEDITITEVGIAAKMYVYNDYFGFLLDHTLLDTPVTIPAGETRTITYEWSF